MSSSAAATPAVTVTPGGLAPDVWGQALTDAPVWDPSSVGQGTLLVLSAHPDDETIGFGRSVARWARSCGPVDLVSLTAGEACLDSISQPSPAVDRTAIGHLRRAELSRAGTALGVRSVRCRGLPDAGLESSPGRVAAEVERAVTRSRPVLIAAPWAADPHPDHRALGTAAAEVARRHSVPLVEYPIWASYWAPLPEEPEEAARLSLLPCDAQDEDSRDAAIRCYPSQYSDFFVGIGPVVPASMLAHHHLPFAFRPQQSEDTL